MVRRTYFDPRATGSLQEIFKYWSYLHQYTPAMKAEMNRQIQTGGIAVDPPLHPDWDLRQASYEFSIFRPTDDHWNEWEPASKYQYKILRRHEELYGPQPVGWVSLGTASEACEVTNSVPVATETTPEAHKTQEAVPVTNMPVASSLNAHERRKAERAERKATRQAEKDRRIAEAMAWQAESMPDLNYAELREPKGSKKQDPFTRCKAKIPDLSYNEFRIAVKAERKRRRALEP